MKTTARILAALVLFSLTPSLVLAESQPLPRPPSADDIALHSLPLPLPGANTQAEWDSLLQHAREAARVEYEAEREVDEQRRKRDDQRSGEGQEQQQGGVKVVRETFYVPVEARIAQEQVNQAVEAASAVPSPALPHSGEAADIVKTVSKLGALKPLFTYAIHHPLRFLFRFLLLPLFSLLTFLLSTLLSLVLSLLLTLLSPLQLLLSVLFSPFSAFLSLNKALMPLWLVLIFALSAGAGLGAVAGLVAGRTTREIIDETVSTGRRSLIWVGVLPKPAADGVREKARDVDLRGGQREEARLEEIPRVFGSSRRKAQEEEKKRAEKAKGKARALLPELDDLSEDEDAAYAGEVGRKAFNPISTNLPLSAVASSSSFSSVPAGGKPRFPIVPPHKQGVLGRSGGADESSEAGKRLRRRRAG
ncbi:hypothetical protein JCM8547_002400 [Rhodosporidiobolus lusitaniae]